MMNKETYKGERIWQTIEFNLIVEEHEKKAEKSLKKEYIKNLMAQGIDKLTAVTMANVFYEYKI